MKMCKHSRTTIEVFNLFEAVRSLKKYFDMDMDIIHEDQARIEVARSKTGLELIQPLLPYQKMRGEKAQFWYAGFEVKDAEAKKDQLEAAGYIPYIKKAMHGGRKEISFRRTGTIQFLIEEPGQTELDCSQDLITRVVYDEYFIYDSKFVGGWRSGPKPFQNLKKEQTQEV